MVRWVGQCVDVRLNMLLGLLFCDWESVVSCPSVDGLGEGGDVLCLWVRSGRGEEERGEGCACFLMPRIISVLEVRVVTGDGRRRSVT